MKKKKGFTLIEVLASMTMVLILFLIVYTLISTSYKLNNVNEKQLDLNNISKAFVELVDSKKIDDIFNTTSNPPSNNVLPKIEGTYQLEFNDLSNDFDKNNQPLGLESVFTDFIKNPNKYKNPGKSNNNYAIRLKINRDKTFNGEIFKIESSTLNLKKDSDIHIDKQTYVNYIKEGTP